MPDIQSRKQAKEAMQFLSARDSPLWVKQKVKEGNASFPVLITLKDDGNTRKDWASNM